MRHRVEWGEELWQVETPWDNWPGKDSEGPGAVEEHHGQEAGRSCLVPVYLKLKKVHWVFKQQLGLKQELHSFNWGWQRGDKTVAVFTLLLNQAVCPNVQAVPLLPAVAPSSHLRVTEPSAFFASGRVWLLKMMLLKAYPKEFIHGYWTVTVLQNVLRVCHKLYFLSDYRSEYCKVFSDALWKLLQSGTCKVPYFCTSYCYLVSQKANYEDHIYFVLLGIKTECAS